MNCFEIVAANVADVVVAEKIPNELHWEVFSNNIKIGSFWHGDGRFWFNILPDSLGTEVPENLVETKEKALYVHQKCAEWIFGNAPSNNQ
jgi:hypothetical protein